jgi:hypothetical protein
MKHDVRCSQLSEGFHVKAKWRATIGRPDVEDTMKSVIDWLEQASDESFSEDISGEQRAEIIRAKAEAAGYSADELNMACSGNIAEYLKNRRRDVATKDEGGKMAGDAFPIPVPGFNQQ